MKRFLYALCVLITLSCVALPELLDNTKLFRQGLDHVINMQRDIVIDLLKGLGAVVEEIAETEEAIEFKVVLNKKAIIAEYEKLSESLSEILEQKLTLQSDGNHNEAMQKLNTLLKQADETPSSEEVKKWTKKMMRKNN